MCLLLCLHFIIHLFVQGSLSVTDKPLLIFILYKQHFVFLREETTLKVARIYRRMETETTVINLQVTCKYKSFFRDAFTKQQRGPSFGNLSLSFPAAPRTFLLSVGVQRVLHTAGKTSTKPESIPVLPVNH